MTQQPSGLNIRGAVDLSSLAPRAPRPAGSASAPASGQGPGTYVVDATEETFQDVIELSMQVPVVIDLWSTRSPASHDLGPLLSRLAEASGGRWVLARVDVDASPRIAQAFGVQSLPAVFAVIKGQPVPLFQEVLPEAAVTQYLTELLRVAESQGVTGVAPPFPGGVDVAPAEVPVEPELDEAFEAIERDDLDTAVEAYRRLLNRKPADDEAAAGLAQVELLRRVRGVDAASTRRDAADRPDDVAAQTLAADLELLGGHVEDAFARLVETVRRTAGEDRTAARDHLVTLFGVVGMADPRVAKARTALANALF